MKSKNDNEVKTQSPVYFSKLSIFNPDKRNQYFISKKNQFCELFRLRDTFASHLIMQGVMSGVELLTVSRYSGHSDVKVTEKFDWHLSPGHYREAIKKLPY